MDRSYDATRTTSGFRHHNLSEEASSDQQERVEVEIDTSCEVTARNDHAIIIEPTTERAVTEPADTARPSTDTNSPVEQTTETPAIPAPPTVRTPAKVYPKWSRAQPDWFDGPRKKPIWIDK